MLVAGLIALGVLVVLGLLMLVVSRRRSRSSVDRTGSEDPVGSEDHLGDDDAVDGPGAEGPSSEPARGRDAVEMPPAAIRVAVDGSDPWEPARAFTRDLCDGEHEPSVEMDDFVVLRDAAREPLVIREVPGHADEVLITTTPGALSDALEALVRSLLSEGYSIERTEGRAITLDRDGQSLALTVEQPASA